MRIEISSMGLLVSEALRSHAEKIARSAFDGFQARIHTILILFSALSPRPGFPDIECRIRVSITGQRGISGSCRSSSILAAVDGAADRVARSMSAKLGPVNPVEWNR